MSRRVALVLWFLLAVPLSGAGAVTDAENLGFVGPVKWVSTMIQGFMPGPQEPNGLAIIYQLAPEIYEFDRSGNQVGSRSGSQQQRTIRDAQRRVKEEITENSPPAMPHVQREQRNPEQKKKRERNPQTPYREERSCRR